MVKGLSPTQRTLRELRNRGLVADICEKFNPHAGPFGVRKDLFGILDIIALDPQRGVVGVQSCGQSLSAHRKKLLEEKAQETSDWLGTPGTVLEIWSWRKVKRKRLGKAMIWAPKIEEIKLEDLR